MSELSESDHESDVEDVDEMEVDNTDVPVFEMKMN